MSDTFWGIIITAVVTLSASLGSIILTNHYNNRRLQAQLAHDRDLKNRDREIEVAPVVWTEVLSF